MRTWTRATPLQRDSRDTLWLVLALALCLVPHLHALPLWCSTATVAALAWRAVVAWGRLQQPPRLLLLLCLLAAVGLTVVTYHGILGRQPGMTLVTMLAALKTLEMRERRDAFVVCALGLFMIFAQFLSSQSPGTALLALVALLALFTAMILAQRPNGHPTLRSAGLAASRSLVMGVPLMLALYVFFPRFGPLWSAPGDAWAHTGLSDQVQLGSVSQLAQDDSVAMRLKFLGAPPAVDQLYFRGPVLDHFDGRVWRNSLQPDEGRPPITPAAPPLVRILGRAVRYEVTIEPNHLYDVPLLDGTIVARAPPPWYEPRLTHVGLSWWAKEPLNERVFLQAQAWPIAREEQPSNWAVWLQLPAHRNPRTLRWARDVLQQLEPTKPQAEDLAQAVLKHIREGGYRYTLEPGNEGTDAQGQPIADLVDQFWLDRRSGFCEHFASAFVVIMRAMGVPSRLVTGYQGAELNPVDGVFEVRNSDAHAWAEIWLPEQGWQRIDPTAAIAPERVELPRHAPLDAGTLPGVLSQLNPAAWTYAHQLADALDHRWNLWILQYSSRTQADMLRSWGLTDTDWASLLRVCAGLLGVLALIGATWAAWQRRRAPRSVWDQPLRRLHRQLLRAGYQAPADQPAPASALAWAVAIQAQCPPAIQGQDWGRGENPNDATGQSESIALTGNIIRALRELDALRYGLPDIQSSDYERAAIGSYGLRRWWRQTHLPAQVTQTLRTLTQTLQKQASSRTKP